MTQIDPRIARRRRQVQEERAHSSLRRVLSLLAMGAVVAAAVWVARSPLFQIEDVVVSGVASSRVEELLVEAGVVPGTPLVSVDVGEVEALLETDPWVESVRVVRSWPRQIRVKVTERVPVAVIRRTSGLVLASVDGVSLTGLSEPDPRFAVVEPEPGADPVPGLVFAAELRADLAAGAVIRVGREELEAEVAGYRVRLGRGVDMVAKARALAAVVDARPPEGAVITLVAPTRPAVSIPQADDGEASQDVEHVDAPGEG